MRMTNPMRVSVSSQLAYGMLGALSLKCVRMRLISRVFTASAIRSCAIATTLLIAGCATMSSSGPVATQRPSPPEESGRYETVAGRGPAIVADLRASAAPAEPVISDGKNLDADA